MVRFIITSLLVVCSLAPARLRAHPGSGIFADGKGNIYFVDTGSGVWKLAPDGTLTKLQGPAFHWMAIDPYNMLQRVALPGSRETGGTLTRVGAAPTLLLSSDFPVAVAPDGSLFYPRHGDREELEVLRFDTAGKTTVLAKPVTTEEAEGRSWLSGIALTSDGTLFFTQDRAVRSVSPRGAISTVIDSLTLPGCGKVPGVEAEIGPYLRGLDVDSAGAIYVAATGCGAVLKITPDKTVTVMLRATSPWSPTGVTVSGGDVYVLEYFHTEGDDRSRWYPRIRKITRDGGVTTVATIERR